MLSATFALNLVKKYQKNPTLHRFYMGLQLDYIFRHYYHYIINM